jgi:ribonuclease HI
MEQLSFGAPGKAEREQGAWIIAYCDGGSRGNPGPAGFGVYIQDDKGAVVAELSEYLGKKTNNYAEYSGMLAALQFALDKGHERLRIISDSELMVKQIKGQYRVNSPELRPLYEEARRRIAQLRAFQIQHVLRGKNKHADRLANLAMDRGMGRATPEAGVPGVSPMPIPISRIPISRTPRGGSVGNSIPVPAPQTKTIRGFVKGGVIHLVEGELPDGVFVKIVRE